MVNFTCKGGIFFFFLQGCLSVKSVSTSWFAGAQAQQDRRWSAGASDQLTNGASRYIHMHVAHASAFHLEVLQISHELCHPMDSLWEEEEEQQQR